MLSVLEMLEEKGEQRRAARDSQPRFVLTVVVVAVIVVYSVGDGRRVDRTDEGGERKKLMFVLQFTVFSPKDGRRGKRINI